MIRILSIQILLSLALTGAAGCSDNSSSNTANNRQDASTTQVGSIQPLLHPIDNQARQKLRELSASIAVSNRVSPENYAELMQLYQRHGDSPLVIDLLIQAHTMRIDWEGLAALMKGLPPSQRNRQLLAGALIKANRFDEAIDLLLKNESLWEKGEWEWLMAFASFHNGDFSTSEKYLDRLVPTATGQRLVEVLELRSLTAIKTGDLTNARSFLERAVELNPHYVPALITLTFVLNSVGEVELAKALDKKAMVARNAETAKSQLKLRMSALGVALTEAWQRQDFERTEELIEEMLPHVDANQRDILEEYRVEIMLRQPLPGSGKKK